MIAETILAQLGGRRFTVMTGAKNFLDGETYLQFDLPARLTKNGGNKCRITLDANDTYTLSLMKYSPRTLSCRTLAERGGIYAENLKDVFTSTTGLDTHI